MLPKDWKEPRQCSSTEFHGQFCSPVLAVGSLNSTPAFASADDQHLGSHRCFRPLSLAVASRISQDRAQQRSYACPILLALVTFCLVPSAERPRELNCTHAFPCGVATFLRSYDRLRWVSNGGSVAQTRRVVAPSRVAVRHPRQSSSSRPGVECIRVAVTGHG